MLLDELALVETWGQFPAPQVYIDILEYWVSMNDNDISFLQLTLSKVNLMSRDDFKMSMFAAYRQIAER